MPAFSIALPRHSAIPILGTTGETWHKVSAICQGPASRRKEESIGMSFAQYDLPEYLSEALQRMRGLMGQ